MLLLGVTRIPTSPVPARRPCSLPIAPRPTNLVVPFLTQTPSVSSSSSSDEEERDLRLVGFVDAADTKPKTTVIVVKPPIIMDRSVDSIGTCSLDVDASVEMSDTSEKSSLGTLKSVSLKSSSGQEASNRLPSYLSLACTVNGYCTTTNYDPVRLARSRDTSPHRPHENHAQDNLTYAVHNNLLSPPNLVPLPMQKYTMAEQTITHHHQEFYTSTKSYISKESFASSIYSKDSVDSCLEKKYTNGVQNQKLSKKVISESVEYKSSSNENKSFIQQRVERLYGPGALAQGFLVINRQKNRSTEWDSEKSFNSSYENDSHSKSMCDKLHADDASDANMKQSTSSPSLPVLRHLTPEFRAQLPMMSPRRMAANGDSSMQKSTTFPTILDSVNGDAVEENGKAPVLNGCSHHKTDVVLNNGQEQSDVKDGHYFLQVLDREAERLLALGDKAEEELKAEGLSEDTKGFLRSASGKARLLVSQKMQQFKGLCTNNINQVEGNAFPTTNDDLQGFWDMVMLQVHQIDDLFKEMEELKANNWVEKKKTVDVIDSKVSNNNKVRKPAAPRVQSAGAEEARKKREAQRKQMIEDRRKAMRQQKQMPRQSIEIYVPESS